MLVPVRIEVKRSRIRHVASGIVGYDSDIIAYLALIGIALERIKRIADRDVRRPCNAAIRTPGIE